MDRVARPARRPRRDARAPLRPARSSSRARRRAGRPSSQQRARLALREPGTAPQALERARGGGALLQAALELWPREDPERPALLLRYVRSTDGDANLRDVLVEEARDGFLAAGDFESCGQAEALWAFTWWVRGNRAEIEAHLHRALALVPAEAEPMRAYLLSQVSRFAMLAERHRARDCGRP